MSVIVLVATRDAYDSPSLLNEFSVLDVMCEHKESWTPSNTGCGSDRRFSPFEIFKALCDCRGFRDLSLEAEQTLNRIIPLVHGQKKRMPQTKWGASRTTSTSTSQRSGYRQAHRGPFDNLLCHIYH